MKPSMRDILRATAKHFNMSAEELTSCSRKHAVAWPRMIAMYLARQMNGMSFPEIGAKLRLDHSTIIHGTREVERAAYGNEVLIALMAIAAEATAAARIRASRELDLVQDLHAGRSLVAVRRPSAPAPSRRVFVPTRARGGPQRPRQALPSDLMPPTTARLMGARA